MITDNCTNLKQADKFFRGYSGFPDNILQGAFGNLFVVRNGEATMGRRSVPEDHMAAFLMIKEIADLG